MKKTFTLIKLISLNLINYTISSELNFSIEIGNIKMEIYQSEPLECIDITKNSKTVRFYIKDIEKEKQLFYETLEMPSMNNEEKQKIMNDFSENLDKFIGDVNIDDNTYIKIKSYLAFKIMEKENPLPIQQWENPNKK